MYEHNALGYRSGLALCLTKVRSSRARCPATALIAYAKCCFLLTWLIYFEHGSGYPETTIMKTCPCNIQRFFSPVKIENFLGFFKIFFLFFFKT